ncbi:DNA-methyltransferase [Enterococcus faecalis]|uniref:DNA-methyltransferase n=1 Tax=Enterococcus faecalis TaxID=1351 RepID=UPI000353E2B7|nr:site-specific DNA-methyltransferase [Enterococcus faecalis]EGO6012984.1 site-specific DNA-methyltransferase [Enterococcus faecalis]EPI37877.1 DNA (cytosine-5-)-methyltransferase [Enterococcus faecalis LA3B-2]MBD9843949.1 site-specific DNA-methyltransferase [Enterococcus faecalis]PQB52569.1 site-specific DNA-methyltransferase [Enterococcus faecalis]HAP2773256.1 site-specific DNA-methyltransferase [Enterococcus faecalis]
MDLKKINEYADRSIIANEDSLEFMKSLPDNSVDLIISSPPYNVGKEYEDKVTLDEYLAFQKEIISEIYRILKPTGNVAWEVGNYIDNKEVYPLDILFYPIFKELGFKLRNRIIWRFGHGLHAKLRFSGRYETILWFSKSDEYTFNLDPVRIPSKYPGKRHYKGNKKGELSGNPKGKNPEDVWDIILQDWEEEVWNIVNVKANHVEKTEHPAQFPIELVDRLILALSNSGDTVLDPFGGSGSTLISAVKNSRKGISIDLSKKYTKIADDRLSKLREGSLNMRPITRPVYKPKKDSVSKVPVEWQGKGVYKNED